MLVYLLKSAFCLAVFLSVYHLFLEKERMHRFNRWYLLLAIVASFTVPLLQFNVSQDSMPVLQNRYFEFVAGNTETPVPATPVHAGLTPTPAPATTELPFVWIVYTLVAAALLFRFGRNLYHLLAATRKNKTVPYADATLVLTKDPIASYSFLRYIFINEDEYNGQAIEDELITHELTHVRQKHSFDIIFIELLQALCWFNPLLLLYRKAIQLNHEFLADEAVVRAYEDVPAYQHLLLAKAGCNSYAYLASNFNYSVTKKRLIMLTHTYNPFRAALKKMAVLPVLALAVLFFSTKNLLMAQDTKQESKPSTQKQKTNRPPAAMLDFTRIPITSEEGISQAELDEYRRIEEASIKLSAEKNKAPDFTGTESDRERLLALFKKMNRPQRRESRIIFEKKLDPPAKKTPTVTQFEKWKNASDYGVWIDEKKVSNDALNSYQSSDFSYYFASNLNYTEKQKQHIMDMYNLKTMYKVQVNLYTDTEYKKMVNASLAAPLYGMLYHLSRNENGRQVDWRFPFSNGR